RSGTYTVLVTDANGCTARATAGVTVNILPTATASSNTPVCAGNELKLTVNEFVNGTYSWSGPLSFTSSLREPSIATATTANAGVYTVSVKDANGCTATTTTTVVVDKCLKLGDYVWNDVNNNGKVDAGETGIDGVKVELFKAKADGTTDGAAVASQNTVAGKYLFTNLEPGDYIVQITAPAGYKSSTGTNGSATGTYEPAQDPDNNVNDDDNGTTTTGQVIQSKAITLTNFGEPINDGDTDNNSNLTVDFGLYKPGSLGDFVWYDTNRDGIQDAGETGVKDVTVKLYDKDNNLVGTATTDANGNYKFTDLAPNDYKVEFSTLPTGYVFSTKDATTDDKDSDADATGKTASITLTAGQDITTVDAGINCPAPKAEATGATVCLNEKIQLTSTNISSPLVDATYSWTKVGGTFTSTEQSPLIAVNASAADAGTYMVTMTSKNGCSATATATAIVTVNALPTATATSNSPVCLNNKLTLEVLTNGTSYAWTGPAGSGFTSTSQKPEIASVSVNNGGVYTVVVTNGNNCSITSTVNVVVNALPTATATGTEVCVGKPINLTATAGFTTYAWTKVGGTFTASTQSPLVNASAVTGDAGTYQVLVTNANGCTAIATAAVIVNDLPTPTASSNGEVCVGTTINLKATGGVSYTWSGINGFTATTADASIANAVTANAGVYTVTVTNAKGCVATATTEVKVNTNPNPTITPIAPICLGSDIVLNVSGGAGNKFTWSGSNGFASTEQNPTVSPKPTTAGTYTYFVTVEGVGGCTGTATTSVTVKSNPTIVVPSISICAGTTGKLVASGADVYAWSNVDGGFTTTSAELSVTKGGVYTVSGVIAGCVATVTTTVEVKALPTITVPTIEICAGTTGKLVATGGVSYAWSGPETFTTTSAELSVTKAGVYTVIGTNAGGCTAMATTEVKVNTNPNPTITPIAPICLGSDIVLNVSGGAGNKFVWSGSNGFASTEQNPTVSPKPTTAGTYTYFVTVEGVGGCTGTATTSVVVNALPTAVATGAEVCVGKEIKLSVSPEFTTYAWTKVGGTFTATTQSPVVNASAVTGDAGTYQVKVTDANGCTAIATATVIVNDLPTPTASNNGPVCVGTTINLKATGGVSYAWSGANNFTATTADASIANATTTNAGVYTVTVTNAKGCTAVATTEVKINTNPNPIATSNTAVCLGGDIKLSVTETTGATYTWSGDNFTSTVREPVISSTKAGTFTYTVTVAGNGGCTGTATTSVIVNALPTATATGAEVCAGTVGTLKVTETA
ncbi:SdrD B-like domain-containing protein, partial [Arcicella aurantiaca]|uniref:SdrD B-like domain-containing protein n=1 Tax=Arcicella aurantiaca TaxID=591202 RepID=UPI001B886AD7